MANAKKTEKDAALKENVEQTVSKTEQFYNANKKTIWGLVIAVVVVGVAVLAYNKFILQPKCEEAMEQCYPAENLFRNGEYELALNGDGNILGFAQIIEDYGSKAGNAAYLYAGICALNNGAFEDAVSYLGKYKGKDPILYTRALSCKGDAYVGLEQYESALSCFSKAAKKAGKGAPFYAASYLVKAGLAAEALGKKDEALKFYQTVKNDYPQSIEAYEIDKYIAAVEE